MSFLRKRTPFQLQMLYVAVQGLSLVAALLTSGLPSTIFWVLFAVLTVTKYVGVARSIGRKRGRPKYGGNG